jgi:hypothetical protein
VTYAVVESRNALAVVDFVLLEEVNEVKDAVALSANENIRLSHFLLGFYKRLKTARGEGEKGAIYE